MDWRRLVFGLDWTTRIDFIVSFIFDWRKWLWGLVPSGGGVTFLWAAIDNRSPLDVWIAAMVVMAALAFVVFVTLKVIEGSKDRAPVAIAKPAASPSGQNLDKFDTGLPHLMVHFKPRIPYETSVISNGHVLSTVKIGLKASGRALSNCRVSVEKIAPQPKLTGGLPILLGGGDFIVRPDDPETLIDIASQWDHTNQFRFAAPLAPVYGGALNYLDDNIARVVEIKIAVGDEFQKTATFKIWTDAAKKLHLQRM